MPGILSTGNPVNRDHWSSAGRMGWWMGLPHNSGGKFLCDLAGNSPGTLSTTSTVTPAWMSRSPRPGSIGQALGYDGSTSYVTVPGFAMPATNTATVACWAYSAASQSAYANLAFARATSAIGTGIAVNNVGTYTYQWAGGGGTSTQYNWSGGPAVVNGVWTFLCLVITPTNATIYSGTGGPLATAVNAVANTAQAVSGLLIGHDAFNGGRLWNGQMDDIGIWNYSFLPWQAEALYRESLAGYPESLNWVQPWAMAPAAVVAPRMINNISFAYQSF